MASLWIEMCSPCKSYGAEHAFDCTCHTAALASVPVVELPSIPPPDAFTALQLRRDQKARIDNSLGDWCKRYVTCGRCQWTSRPVNFWSEMDSEEDDHMLHGCTAPAPAYPEPDGVTWPYPEPWKFHYRIEPADEREDPGPSRGNWFHVAGRRAPIVLHMPVRAPMEEVA